MMLRRRLIGLAGLALPSFLAVVLLGLAVVVLSLVQARLAAEVLGRVLSGEPWERWAPALGLLATVVVLGALGRWLREASSLAAGAVVKRRLRRSLFQGLLDREPSHAARSGSGHHQAVLVDAVEAMEGYVAWYLPQAAVCLVGTGLLLGVLATVDAAVAAVATGGWLLALFGPRLWERLLGDYGEAPWLAQGQLHDRFLDALRGMTTLKVFSAADRFGAVLRQDAAEVHHRTRAQLALVLGRNGISTLATGLTGALVIGLAAVRGAAGELGVEDLLLVLFLAGACLAPLVDLEQQWIRGYGGVSAAPAVFAVLDAPAPVDPPRPPRPLSKQPDLRFEDVGFTYPGAARPALRSLRLQLGGDELVALVGPSGSGKSTVAALALRFLEPSEGRILLDGLPLGEWPRELIRRTVGLVSQAPYLFPGSLEDNLRLGRPGADGAVLRAAVRAAALEDVVEARGGGLGTRLGESGEGLSGGERQRLALARALVADAPLLLLDEATSQVDPAMEGRVLDGLRAWRRGRPTLMVVHRLAAAVRADRILVLDRGRLVEEGDHRSLLRINGLYARLWRAQQAEEP